MDAERPNRAVHRCAEAQGRRSGIYNDRQAVVDDGVSRRLTLQKDPNVVRAAIINGGGATDFCARFLDGEYRPVKDFRVTLADR
jgi:hypothetical protein